MQQHRHCFKNLTHSFNQMVIFESEAAEKIRLERERLCGQVSKSLSQNSELDDMQNSEDAVIFSACV